MILDASNRPYARIFLAGAMICMGMCVLLVTLYHLQVGRGEEYTSKVREQSTRQILLPPARGLIYDRWGIPLAELRPSIDVDLYLIEIKSEYLKRHRKLPYMTNQVRKRGVLQAVKEVDIVRVVDEQIAPLKQILGTKLDYDPSALVLHQRIRENVPFQLKSDLSFDEISQLVERISVVHGVHITPRPVRSYSYGATACHILGYVGKPEEAKVLDRDGKKIELETVGKDGIESLMDDDLQGNPGFRTVEVNNYGNIQRLVEHRNPSLGDSIYLSIDLRVQQIVERVMACVGRGACVVQDVKTGDILAMVSVPNFDPNTVVTKEGWKDISKNEAHPLLNRALSPYAPGSIYKIVVALAALKHNTVDSRFSTSCGGGMWIADRFRKCWSFDKGGCGTQDLIGGIKRSCNVYFYTVGIRTGLQHVSDMSRDLGLGEPQEIPLPHPSNGLVPSLDYWKKTYPKDRFSNGHMANVSIGQGVVAISPLQAVNIPATVANGGISYYPRLIKEIRDSDGNLVREEPVRERARLQVPPEKMEWVRKGMEAVVGEGGTGRRAAVEGYKVAGKTGSAQFPTRIRGRQVKDTRTWFNSYAPADEPRYAICMMVEGGVSGGSTCAPLVSEIYTQIFNLERSSGAYQLAYMQPVRGHFDGVQEIVEEAPNAVQGIAVPMPAELQNDSPTEANDDNTPAPAAQPVMPVPAGKPLPGRGNR